jgi:mRNA-degrading endonuclease YafQ of YafQ-DinJ toxin-antitoxin module
VTGSIPFLIERSENFDRSFKKLSKVHGEKLVILITQILEDLIDDPYPLKSRIEPQPGSIQLPEEWTFHKLEIWVSKGASGQIRLMYLVNKTTCIIRLAWIYSHEQYAKRPSDADLKSVIREILDS